jgi:hypothetical protein
MWKNSLLDGLAFYSEGKLQSGSKAPTWSLASEAGRVQFFAIQRLPTLQLLDLVFTRVGPAHIGEVSHAIIKLTGPTFEVMMHHEQYRSPELRFFAQGDRDSIVELDSYNMPSAKDSYTILSFCVVMVLSSYIRDEGSPAIVLKQLQTTKFYRRLGVVILHYRHDEKEQVTAQESAAAQDSKGEVDSTNELAAAEDEMDVDVKEKTSANPADDIEDQTPAHRQG